MKKVIAGAILLAAGCGDGSSSTSKLSTPQNPPAIFANYVASTDDGAHVVVEDEREATKGNIIGITPDAQTSRVLATSSPNRTDVQEVVGDNAVLNISDGKQRDLVVADIATGRTVFKTDTSINEWFIAPAGNGILYEEHDPATGQFSLRMADFNSGTSTPLQLSQPKAYVVFRNRELALAVGYGSGKQAIHKLDAKTGAITLLFDLNKEPDSLGHFMGPITPELFAYPTQQGIVFRTNTGVVSTYSPSQTSGFSHWVREASSKNLQAIIDRADNNTNSVELLHVDLRFSPALERRIDLSQTGIKAEDASVVIGREKTILQAYDRNSGTSLIRFYDPNQNAVVDLLSRFGNVVDAYAIGNNGTALIMAQIDTPTGVVNKLLHFDGYDVSDPFGNYDAIKQTAKAQDAEKHLIIGERAGANGQTFRDLYHFDSETAQVTPLYSIVRGFFNSLAISRDGQNAAFSTMDWVQGDNRVMLATAGNVAQLGKSSSQFEVYGFTADGSKLFVKRSSGPRKIERIDAATGNPVFVCNSD